MLRLDQDGNHEARKRDTRRKIIAGAIVLKHAQTDPEFAAVLNDLLGRFVLERDRHLFGLEDRSRFAAAFANATNGGSAGAVLAQSVRHPGSRERRPRADI